MSVREKAVLAALRRPKQPRFEVDESLDELGRLAESAGAEVVGRMTQDRRAPTPGNRTFSEPRLSRSGPPMAVFCTTLL